MRVYLAGRYSRRLELCAYREVLHEVFGIKVQARWLAGSHQLDNSGTPIGDYGKALVEAGDRAGAAALRVKFANDDLEDVLSATHVVAFTEQPRASTSRGGRHVEFGIALGRGIPVAIVGPRENIFCWLPQVEQFDDWSDAMLWLAKARQAS